MLTPLISLSFGRRTTNRPVSRRARRGGGQEQSHSWAAHGEMVTRGCCLCSDLQL